MLLTSFYKAYRVGKNTNTIPRLLKVVLLSYDGTNHVIMPFLHLALLSRTVHKYLHLPRSYSLKATLNSRDLQQATYYIWSRWIKYHYPLYWWISSDCSVIDLSHLNNRHHMHPSIQKTNKGNSPPVAQYILGSNLQPPQMYFFMFTMYLHDV